MSKTNREARTALIEARLIEEQEWAYARWLERMSYRQMRALGCLAVEQGGLGRDISPVAYKHLVTQAREAHGDLTLSREERLERMNAENDDLARALRYELNESRERVGRVDLKLAGALLDIQKREAELNGVNAPTKVEAEIVTKTAVEAELDAMLGRIPSPESETTP
jgi:hypothetical protein